MEKIWLKKYPQDIPHEIHVSSQSITQEFETAVQKYNSKTAFTNYDESLSFEEWSKYSNQFSAFLQRHLKKGDRIAVMLPNTLQFPVAVMSALQAGLVVVNINPLYTSRELKHILKDADVKALLILAHSAHTFSEIASDKDLNIPLVIVTQLGDFFSPFKRILFYTITNFIKKMKPYKFKHISFRKALKQGAFLPLKKTYNELTFLQYTGGTTGTPKGAMLTHKNILSNLEQCRAWMHPFLNEGQETSVIALPLYHIFALMVNLLVLSLYGSHSILITNPRDTKPFIQLLKKTKSWSVFTGVNALFKLLLNQEEFKEIDFTNLKVCIAGGTAVESAVYKEWHTATGTALVEGYGLTEASPVVSCNIISEPLQGNCGYPFPSTEVRIVDPSGKTLDVGQEGELHIKGPQVMKGYWQKPQETAQVLDSEGWLKTGDIARINKEGYLQILDRKKDMILVSGFNVFPNEIEQVLSEHPQVKDSAVIGVPDEHSSQVPKAFIVRKDSNLNEEEVEAFLRKSLVAYKIPKYIEFVDELPLSYVGKVLRRSLRDSKK
ncbi:MAG: AMP-binding protein [Bdellovibrionales bacterium]|nr:AMP-binding protein [Bdellovibrionales bacterium]